jgi:hypothetical protein
MWNERLVVADLITIFANCLLMYCKKEKKRKRIFSNPTTLQA